jgi:hypothetical protein
MFVVLRKGSHIANLGDDPARDKLSSIMAVHDTFLLVFLLLVLLNLTFVSLHVYRRVQGRRVDVIENPV